MYVCAACVHMYACVTGCVCMRVCMDDMCVLHVCACIRACAYG